LVSLRNKSQINSHILSYAQFELFNKRCTADSIESLITEFYRLFLRSFCFEVLYELLYPLLVE